MLSKWVITLNAAIPSTNHGLAHCVNKSVTGGQPARMRKRQMTSEMMKLTTWLRVIAEVGHQQVNARFVNVLHGLLHVIVALHGLGGQQPKRGAGDFEGAVQAFEFRIANRDWTTM